MANAAVVHPDEHNIVDAVLAELRSSLLPRYRSRAAVPFPSTVIASMKAITEMADEIHLYAMEGHVPTNRGIAWRVAFIVAVYANMMLEANMSCEEARTMLCYVLHEVGVPVRAAKIALVRYKHLIAGENVEHVDDHVLPREMQKLLIGR